MAWNRTTEQRREWSRRCHAAKARKRLETTEPEYQAEPPPVHVIVTIDLPTTGTRRRIVLASGGHRRDQVLVRVGAHPWKIASRTVLGRILARQLTTWGD